MSVPVASVIPLASDPPATTVRIVPDCARFVILNEPEVVTVTEDVVAAKAIGTGPVNVNATARKRATTRKKGCRGLSSRVAGEVTERFDTFIRDKGKVSRVIYTTARLRTKFAAKEVPMCLKVSLSAIKSKQ